MYGGKQTLYDILDLRRNAKDADVVRAYQRLKAERAKGLSTPDPRRVALLHEAYEVLSDPQRRADYDASLRDSKFFRLPEGATPGRMGGIVAGVLILLAALYFFLRPSGPAHWKAQQIVETASGSAGRLQSLDVSGRATTVGLAFAVRPGVIVTTCHGITTGAQLVLRLETRSVPARISIADGQLDLCKLSGEDVGNQAPPIGRETPKAGDKVFALEADASGKLAAVEGSVKQLVASPNGQVIEITIPVKPDASGGPLFDAYGRLIGITIAPHGYGAGLNIALPAAWIETARSRAAPRR